MWSRPTTPWTLACDATHLKEATLDALEQQIEEENNVRSRSDNTYSAVLAGIGALGLAILTFHIVKSMLKGRKEKKWAALNYITNVMWTLLGVSIFVNAQSNARNLHNKMKKVEYLESFLNSECSDLYTVFP